MAQWLARAGDQPHRYGLVYADPIGKEIPVELLAKVSARLPKVDILSYISATNYKRRGGPRLADHIAAVGKRHAYIREGFDKHQWTFILWTNFPKDISWKKRDFWRLDTTRGQQILDRLNLTKPELHEATNEPLFRMPGDPK